MNGNVTEAAPLGWHLFMSAKCYHSIIDDSNVTEECVRLIASKVISYIIIIATSLFLKLPQIVKIVKNRSAEGVSFTSQLLVILTSSFNAAYSVARGYPISTWAESLVLTVQTFTLTLLMLYYNNKRREMLGYLSSAAAFFAVLFSPQLPLQVHVFLQMCSVPFNASSKLIQIWTNYKRGGTGQLSATSIFTANLRSFGRLYSNITETGDPYRITLFAQAGALNTVLSSQIFYYNRGTKPSSRYKET